MPPELLVPEDSQWKEIPDFPTYWVNQYGQIFAMRKRELVTVHLSLKGYPSVRMYKDKRSYFRGIPKLVSQAFPRRHHAKS